MSNTQIEDVNNHVWVGASLYEEPELVDHFLPFVERHDLALAITDYAVRPENTGSERVTGLLEQTADRGIDVWMGTSVIPGTRKTGLSADESGYTSEQLLESEETMERFLAAMEAVVETYAEYYPEGKTMLWHEAPIMGNWSGENYHERAESMVAHGPELFAAQKERLREVVPDVDVGVFPHDIVMADAEHSAIPICDRLFSRMDQLDALPDFTYTDSYRGYREWFSGYEPTNEFIRSFLANLQTYTHGRPVYYLGQSHTLLNGYTPCKQAIIGNLRTALESGVASYGWFTPYRNEYTQTDDRCFDPFLPHEGTVAEPDDFNAITASRDRFLWSYLLLLEATGHVAPESVFDLWIHGEGLTQLGSRVSLQDGDGNWQPLGYVSGYLDGEYPYAPNGASTSVFHALDRDRFAPEGSVAVRIDENERDATIHEILATPYFDTGAHVIEREATELVETGAIDRFSFGRWHGTTPLGEGEFTAKVPLGEARTTPHEHWNGNYVAERDRLRTIQTEQSVLEHVDLWVVGEDVESSDVTLNGTRIEHYAHPVGDDETGAKVYRGLPRSWFFEPHASGESADLEIVARDTDTTVVGLYVMPCAGASNFTTDAEAAAIVRRDFETRGGQIETFSIAHQSWPGGRSVAEHPINTWLHVANRQAVGDHD